MVDLTMIAAFWSQVDYRAKQMQPWAVLSLRKSQSAANTLLLDYVSANAVCAFFKSMRRRHWPVTLSILGTVFLKALIVFSTTLFILQTQTIERKVDFTSNTTFKALHYNSSLVDGVPAIIGVGTETQKTKYPPWTNELYAVQPFFLSPVKPGMQTKQRLNI
jgi:hypothetical protein